MFTMDKMHITDVQAVQNIDSCYPIVYAHLPNLTEYVSRLLGERCAMPPLVIPTAIIYGLILFLGLLGNGCTCLVILKNRPMQNPTNYYLFSLAISDLLLLVLGLPVELYGVFDAVYPYKFGTAVCKSRAFLTEFTSYASILTITCFSIERWIAICFPLRAKFCSTLERAVRVIVTVWIIAFVAALPTVFIVVINKLPIPEWVHIHAPELISSISEDNETIIGTEYCAMDFLRPVAQRNFIVAAAFFFFLLPALLITFVYFHIVCKLHCTDRDLSDSGDCKKQRSINRSRRGVLKILIAVVIMFFLCWLPYHVQRLLSVILNESKLSSREAINTLFNIVFYISGYCYYSNSACNPILYNILSMKYRLAFCKTVLGERLSHKFCLDTRRTSSWRQSQLQATMAPFKSSMNGSSFYHPVSSVVPKCLEPGSPEAGSSLYSHHSYQNSEKHKYSAAFGEANGKLLKASRSHPLVTSLKKGTSQILLTREQLTNPGTQNILLISSPEKQFNSNHARSVCKYHAIDEQKPVPTSEIS